MKLEAHDWLQAAHHEVQMRRWRDASGKERYKGFTNVSYLKGIAPEILVWYFAHFDWDTYRLWHPSHRMLSWERKGAGEGATHIAWENINGTLCAFRIRLDPISKSPLPVDDPDHSFMLNTIDTEGEILWWILITIGGMGNGTQLSARFTFHEATPDDYVTAHQRHAQEEITGLAERAIPAHIQSTFGYTPSFEAMMRYCLQSNSSR